MMLNLIFAFAAFISATQAAIQNRCQANGVVAISFDDGPADFTNQLLNTLNDKKLKVTFHLTTQYLTDPNVQSTIQRIAADGHLIGLRTDPSWDLFQMSDDQIKASIARQSQVMAQFVGYQPILIRLPYQKFDDRVLRAVESTGAIVSTYNLETYDYTGDSNRILKAYQVSLSLAGSGAGSFISVQHDGVSASVAIFPQVVDLVQNLGYRIIKLDECLGLGDLTKNKKALDGGNGAFVPLSIDTPSSASGGLLPVTPNPLGKGGNTSGGKPFNGGKISAKSSANSNKPFAYTIVAAAAFISLFLFF